MKERHDEKSRLDRIFTGISEDNLVWQRRGFTVLKMGGIVYVGPSERILQEARSMGIKPYR